MGQNPPLSFSLSCLTRISSLFYLLLSVTQDGLRQLRETASKDILGMVKPDNLQSTVEKNYKAVMFAGGRGPEKRKKERERERERERGRGRAGGGRGVMREKGKEEERGIWEGKREWGRGREVERERKIRVFIVPFRIISFRGPVYVLLYIVLSAWQTRGLGLSLHRS